MTTVLVLVLLDTTGFCVGCFLSLSLGFAAWRAMSRSAERTHGASTVLRRFVTSRRRATWGSCGRTSYWQVREVSIW